LAGNSFTFSFASQSGHSYIIRCAETLDSVSWQVLTNLNGNGSTLSFTNRNVPATQRFYRVETQ
jgi:hypothetical protein